MSFDQNPPVDPERTPPPPPPQPAAYAAPDPAMTPAQERSLATLSHVVPMVAMVLSAGTLGFVASLVIYVMYKDRGPFVRQAAANSLNIQIMTGIGLVVSAVLMLVLIGFVTYPLVLVAGFVLHLVAAVRANRGEWYNPPFTPSFVK